MVLFSIQSDHRKLWLMSIAGATAVLATIFWAVIGHNIGTYREMDRQVAETRAMMLAKAYEEYLIRTIRQIDQAALLLRNAYKRDDEAFTEDIRQVSSVIGADLLFQVAVIGQDGVLVYSNLQAAQERVDLSDREHFRVHLEQSGDFLFISKPLLGRVSKKWSIQFTRKIYDNSGRPSGVIVLSVDPYYFGRFAETAALGDGDAMTLIKTDRTILSRVVGQTYYDENSLGLQVEPRSYMADSAPDVGVYETKSSVDGVARIVGYRKLRAYNLFVVALVDQQTAYARTDEAQRVGALIRVAGTILLLLTAGVASIAVCAVFRENTIVRGMHVRLKDAYATLERTNLELRAREAQLKQLSETDPLCHVPNRRKFLAVAETEIARHRRYKRKFSVLLLDIDHFKRVNDTYGHDAGDRVLVAVAGIVQDRVRVSDMVARIGGEEFALLLPETDLQGALVVAESVRTAIAAARIDLSDGQTISVTVSIGIGSLAGEVASITDMLRSADEALYRAKETGRNRVILNPIGSDGMDVPCVW